MKNVFNHQSEHDDTVDINLAQLYECNLKTSTPNYYVAEIVDRVQAHVHNQGDELYQIIKGQGVMQIGQFELNDGEHSNKVVRWYEKWNVITGDTFIVPEGIVHSLINTGSTPLIITFLCNPNHMVDFESGGDRMMVEVQET